MEDEKEFDWKCKECGKDIPKGEGHIKGLCLSCDDKSHSDHDDVENAEMERKAKSKKKKAKDVETNEED